MVHRYPIRNLDSEGYVKSKMCEILIDDEKNHCWIEYKTSRGKLERVWLMTVYNQFAEIIENYNLETEYLTPGPTAI